MIAACPKCQTRYKVDDAKIGANGVRLKCTRCETIFRVTLPEEAPVIEAPVAAPAETRDQAKLVLIADPDTNACKQTGEAIRGWGLQALLVHDGVEAMMTIQRELPRVVVLDAALPKMYGFQICEFMKRNESLRAIPVVLIGAIHDENRYRRSPNEFYGADRYLERPDLPEGLKSILAEFGLPIGASASAPTPTAPPPAPQAVAPTPVAPPAAPPVAVAPPPPTPTPAPVAAVPPPAAPQPTAPPTAEGPKGDGLDDLRAKAERLARVVVSDVVLYNQDKFNQAVQQGTVAQEMQSDLMEGRAHFNSQIDERIRSEKDFLAEELLRVARARGMQ